MNRYFRTISLAVALFSPLVAQAGAVGGAKGTVTQVLANDTDRFEVRFEGGEEAYVRIAGDGDTDLDLYVYDENGNLIASDTSTSDVASVQFTPAWTGAFTIQVRNLGSVYNRYQVATN